MLISLTKATRTKKVPRNSLALVAFLARDYDEAINWFSDALGFILLEDSDHGDGKRWVRMAASNDAETAFLIAKAVGDQSRAIGQAAGGRVGYILVTDDFCAMHERMTDRGVFFEEDPRREAYGTVAVFQDLYGNRWDLLQCA